MSRERPILFSGKMVRSILAGTKTQTRRLVKPPPPLPSGWRAPEFSVAGRDYRCPYGRPGDTLWVRETWRLTRDLDRLAPSHCAPPLAIKYEADGYETSIGDVRFGRLRPSIHMPRWASRITLRVTEVRVERLQDISEEDARADGIYSAWPAVGHSARALFRSLWDDINAKRAPWATNPWVWVVSFERVQL